MQLKKSMQKTKHFIIKPLQNLKNLLFGSYESIPRTLFLNPLSCSSINQRSHQLDHIYAHFCTQSVPVNHQCKADDYQPMKRDDKITTNATANVTDDVYMKVVSSSNEVAANKKPVSALRMAAPSSAASSCRFADDGSYILAQKMKELDMIDSVGDVEHALDVEEALHYYSRLTSPVYVDMVNTFFTDMYTDYVLPQPSLSLSTSSRRLGPLKI